MKVLFLVTITVFLFLGVSSCNRVEEQSTTKAVEESGGNADKTVRKKQILIEAAGSKDATLKIVPGSETTLGLELTNSVPIRGVQFTLTGADMNEIRTTSRSKDFLADFNKEAGKVVILSASGNKIAPGSGLIAELVCDKIDSASLSEIKIVK
jgi:delta 1-pyrroline-5-carboxylate dehydrogenase